MGAPHNRPPMSGYVTKMAIHYSMFKIVDCSLQFPCLVVKSYFVTPAPSSRVALRFLKMILKGHHRFENCCLQSRVDKACSSKLMLFYTISICSTPTVHFLPIKLPKSLLSPCLVVKSFLLCLPCNLGLRLDCSR